MSDDRRLDSNKALWHMDRIISHFDRGERISPVHIDTGLAKFCDISCNFCVSRATKILMADFSWKEIRDVKIGDMIIGFDEKPIPNKIKKNYARYYPTLVTNVFKRQGRTHKIEYGNTSLRITNEHPVLCEGHRWRSIKKLKTNDRIRYFTEPYKTDFTDNYLYKLGYLKGLCEGDGTICTHIDTRPEEKHNGYRMRRFKVAMKDREPIERAKKYFKNLFDFDMSTGIHKSYSEKHHDLDVLRTDKIDEVDMIEKSLSFRKKSDFSSQSQDFSRGYLAGIFDAEGSLSCYCLRIAQRFHKNVISNIENALIQMGYTYKKEWSGFRIVGGYDLISKFLGQCRPASARKVKNFYNLSIPKTVSVNKRIYGEGGVTEDVYNLETESHTYVANGFCVHNCFGRFQNPKREFIERDALLNYVRDSAEVGVRSLAAIGDGEPLMNPAVYEFLSLGKELKLSMAISTNSVTLDTEEKAKTVLESCEWMRICICAGDKEGYIRNHVVDKFDKVTENIERLVNLKAKHGYMCDIALQAVYAPGEMDQDMINESMFAVQMGVDFFLIKQCSLPEDNKKVNRVSFDVNDYDSDRVHNVLNECESYSTEKTKIIPKWNTMARKGARVYKHCPAMPILAEISGNGDYFGCGYFFGNKPEYEKYKFGNIHETRFKDIIQSDRYWSIIKHFREEFDSDRDCHGSCRLDSVNSFLDDYLNKPKNINFI